MIYKDSKCITLQFTDLTANIKLKREQQRSKMLQMLNATVHHEMLSPLKSNVILTKRLVKEFKFEDKRLKKLIKTLEISSQLLLHHSYDLLDFHIFENGGFNSVPTKASLA